ncbi:MAG: S8 family serine peptidase [Nannocystales bacterium]
MALRGGTLAVEPRRPLAKAPLPHPMPGRSAKDHRLVVKFTDAAAVRRTDPGRVNSTTGLNMSTLEDLAVQTGLRLTPLFDAPPEAIDAFARRARERSGREQPDLEGLFRVELETADATELRHVGDQLQALDVVEFVSFQATHAPPPADIDPPTPDLTGFQDYRGESPGMSFDDAIALGYDGSGIQVSDIEYAWTLSHEELEDAGIEPEPGAALGTNFADHGTAVLGILVADVGDYGVDGLCPGSEVRVFPQYTPSGVDRAETAVLNALAGSEPGDVVLFEMQIEGVQFAGAPKEVDSVFWMLSRMATDAGILVVGAAGNGSVNLDAPTLEFYRERGDSGALIVGAGEPDSLAPTDFSSYGSRVDVQAWGRDVFTTGYGTHASYGNDPRQRYDEGFGGTSSASALVTAASVLVLDAFAQAGRELSPTQLRQLLIATGTPQAEGVLVGPRINVGAAVRAVEDDGPPHVEFSAPSEDVVVDAAMHSATLEVEAEDMAGIFSVGLQVNGELLPQIDADPPFIFSDVVFPEGAWEVVAVAEDGLGNVGESELLTIYVGVEPPPPETSSSSGSAGTEGDASTTEPFETDGSQGTTTDDGDASSGPSGDAEGDGSGCRVTGSGTSGLTPWFLLALFGGWTRRRRVRG